MIFKVFLNNSNKFFILKIFFAPCAGLILFKSGLSGSNVKRKPICASCAATPVTAAATQTMNEYLTMMMTVSFSPSLMAASLSARKSCDRKMKSSFKSRISMGVNAPMIDKSTSSKAVEVMSLLLLT